MSIPTDNQLLLRSYTGKFILETHNDYLSNKTPEDFFKVFFSSPKTFTLESLSPSGGRSTTRRWNVRVFTSQTGTNRRVVRVPRSRDK